MSKTVVASDLTNEVVSDVDDSNSDSDSNSDEGEDGEKNVADVKVTKEFQENVVKYVKLDDLIKKKQEEITELKKQRVPCEKHILKFLEDVDENVIDITDGKLRKNKATTKQKLTEDIMKLAIGEYVKDPTQIEAIMKAMETKRGDVTHVNLKRTSKRVPKKKIIKQKA